MTRWWGTTSGSATGATILPGVRIGDGAMVAAALVVASDVAPYSIVAGNPARQTRLRFPAEDIARLLQIAWWNWPAEEITGVLEVIMAGDVDALEKVAEQRADGA